MYNILVCDDDRDIVAALNIYLSAEGYRVLPAYTGQEALRVLRTQQVHLVLMDIMMPQMNGIEATAAIRKESNVPILFLTAKSEDADLVLGLNVGADDYITKPFKAIEVVARVRSHLRRYTQLGGQSGAQQRDYYTVGPITVNDAEKSVTVDGEPVNLTKLEYKMLLLLIRHPGQVFSVSQIYEQVWQEPSLGGENTVAVHIRHLREKIEIDPAHPRYLKVVWGLGYKLEKRGESM